MAWIQNLAGKAEDLLNKIDKNAATVLSESASSKTLKIAEYIPGLSDHMLETNQTDFCNQSSVEIVNEKHNVVNLCREKTYIADDVSDMSEKSKLSETEDDGIYIDFSHVETINVPDLVREGNVLERSVKSDVSLSSTSSSSEDLQTSYEDKVTKLESENQYMNEQLLNLQHLYSELQNENGNLQNQIERANESVASAQNEMEQYKARAQRILHEKEKLILLQTDNDLQQNISDSDMINTYNQELKHELEFQREKNNDLMGKIASLNNEFSILQQQYASMQSRNEQSIRGLQESLDNEKRIRLIAEDECRLKTKELQSVLVELSHQQVISENKLLELQKIRNELKESASHKCNNSDAESHLQTLTQKLLAKQKILETVTAKRNALNIQIEKLNERHRVLMRNQRNDYFIDSDLSDVNDTDDVKSQVPRFMVVSPFDAGVTRKVKHAYSTLDAISIRTGVFLWRYPLARVFVFCYMILLHMWMLIILYTYVP